MGRQPPTDPNASTLIGKLGATADRSRAGRLSLSLDGVTVEVDADAAKPALSEARAMFDLTQALVIQDGAAPGSTRSQQAWLARAEYKVLSYTDAVNAAAKDARLAAKLDRWTALRDQYRSVVK